MTTEEEGPEIPVVCAECGTRSQVAFDDVTGAIERHNDQRHDGDAVSEVDPDVLEALTEQVGRDMGLLD